MRLEVLDLIQERSNAERITIGEYFRWLAAMLFGESAMTLSFLPSPIQAMSDIYTEQAYKYLQQRG